MFVTLLRNTYRGDRVICVVNMVVGYTGFVSADCVRLMGDVEKRKRDVAVRETEIERKR